MEQIVHRSADEIMSEFPNAIVPPNMDSFPEEGSYYQVVNATDYRKELPGGKKNPTYGDMIQKLELINRGNKIEDINSIRNLLNLDGGLANRKSGKYD